VSFLGSFVKSLNSIIRASGTSSFLAEDATISAASSLALASSRILSIASLLFNPSLA